MSLNEPKKIIALMSELSELLESWNINISDDNTHTLALRAEDVSVTDNADSELNKAVEKTETDAAAIALSKETSQFLLDRSKTLLAQAEPILEQAGARVKNGINVVEIWRVNDDNSRDWFNVAQKEYKRSVDEYNEAVNDYNNSLPPLRRAEERLTSCVNRQRRNSDGSVSPSCSGERSEYERCLRITQDLERIMNEKKEVMNRAEEQMKMATEAFDIASRMYSESQVLLKKSQELLDLSASSYRNANDAVSAAMSALEFDAIAEKDNCAQDNLNKDSLLNNDKIHTAMGEVHNAMNSIMDLSDSCERLNALLRSDFDAKSTLMYRFSRVLPDEIVINKRD